ncbi:MAG: hypothetical protein V4577_07500 [Bacteroidota bacterium]
MLKSEINELEKSVGAILDDGSSTSHPGYQQQLAEQVALVKNRCADLKKKWTHELLSSAKELVIKRYVQYHQAGIIRLSDMVSRHVPEQQQSVQSDAFAEVNAEMENVLEFLRRQFYQYFDLDHKATIYYCELLNLKITAFEPGLRTYNNPAVDTTLVATVLLSVNEIVAEGPLSGISYRQADQALNLVRMTHQLLLSGTDTTTDSLFRALYQQNFNSLHFYNWYQEHLLTQLSKINDQQSRQDFINNRIKTLSGIFVSPEKALQAELPSTVTFIIPLLREQTGPDAKQKRVKSSATRFPLNLSVPQFALFIRIFYKAGCFPIDNVAMITRFFTEHFTTKKQPHISSKSFGRAFYSLDQSAAAIVQEYLQKMLNYLNKTYFP